MVVSVGIDVSKDKHDCFILSSEGEVLVDVFTIPNTMDGFNCLLQRIQDCTTPQGKMKVGLEATGHYRYNLLGFLLDNGLATYVLNPLFSSPAPYLCGGAQEKAFFESGESEQRTIFLAGAVFAFICEWLLRTL